ncbi:MAG: hydrogenase expression/formation protein HypE [Candidatus Omnitrophica bacterium]|nr:hydrogenase expression/formation protein HypE [Candidatus Omnitrophota bacterium]
MDKGKITLAHGNGGQVMQKLINKMIISNFGNPILNRLDDGAVLDLKSRNNKLVFTTDSFVVDPIFFPGGDIGKLAVCGTVNDLAMMGAKPLYLSAGVIIEEGFAIADLYKIIISMKKTLALADVKIVCGDTKVVNKGHCDKIFINTSGIGIKQTKARITSSNAQPGDLIIVSGTIGEHGVSIMSQREGLKFKTQLKSDCAPLNGLVADMLKFSDAVHVMRDPTRGGVAAALNEIAEHSNLGIEINEENLPVSSQARGACEILGLDPLYLACEGRLLAFVAPNKAKDIIKVMHENQFGRKAQIIGKVVSGHKKQVYLSTLAGSDRILDVPIADQMPRIC